VQFTAASEAPEKMHFWTGVSVIAGALRRRVWLNMQSFTWTPNFYIVLVAPAGIVAKSTTIGVGTRLLAKVPNIRFGPESMTWQALGQALADATEYLTLPSQPGDANDPGGNGTAKTPPPIPMSCLTIGIGELGTFLRSDDSQLISFLIRVWDGQSDVFRHKTKSSGDIEVPNSWLNIIAATTPPWIRANFSEEFIGSGFTSRVLFVFADKKRHLVPYPDEIIPKKDYYDLEKLLLEDLIHISKLAGEAKLSQFARLWGRDWYIQHCNSPGVHLSSDRVAGYVARKQSHLHKLAIVLSASRRDDLLITDDDLQEAETHLLELEADMLKVFEFIGSSNEAQDIATLCSVLSRCALKSSEDLWTEVQPQMDYDRYLKALKGAGHANRIGTFDSNGKLVHFLVPPTST